MSGPEAGVVFGLVAGIITVLQTTFDTYHAVNDASGLPKTFRTAGDVIPLVLDSLDLAQKNLQAGRVSEDAAKSVKPVAVSCRDNAIALKDTFERYMPSGEDSAPVRAGKVVVLFAKSNKIRDHMQQIEKALALLAQNQIFQDAETLEHITAAVQELGSVDRVEGHSQSSTGSGDNIMESGSGNKRSYQSRDSSIMFAADTMTVGKKVSKTVHTHYPNVHREALNFNDIDGSEYESYKDFNPERVRDTCHWFLHHPTFKQWQSSDCDNLLWLSADPGCGKSVLSKALVDEGLASTGPALTLYFFFKDNHQQNDASIAVRALLYQLFWERTALHARYATPFIKAHGSLRYASFNQLRKLLLEVAKDPEAGTLICILDALDECKDADRKKILTKLNVFYHEAQASRRGPGEPTLKFLVTSRPYHDINVGFSDICCRSPSIRLAGEQESAAISIEIGLVIRSRMGQIRQDLKLKEEHVSSAERILLEMPHRTCLWLKFIFDEIDLEHPATATQLLRVIKQLPSGVVDAYERMLSRCARTENAMKTLHIILAADRALTLTQMDIALGVQSNTSSYEDLQSELAGLEARELQIRHQCGLFVTVVDSMVFLIHQTAKEFLVGQHAGQMTSQAWKHSLTIVDSHQVLADICIKFLLFKEFCNFTGDVPEACKKYDFLIYSALSWAEHFRKSEVNKDNDLTRSATRLYSTDKPLWLMVWRSARPVIQEWQMTDFFTYDYEFRPYSTSVLQTMCYLGQDAIMRCLDLRGESQTDRTSGMCWAVLKGHHRVVELLIENGATIDAVEGNAGSALQAAAGGGRESIVQMLLKKGANVNTRGGDFGSALQAASSYGNERIVELLLQSGAEVDAQRGEYGSALQIASTKGHERVVEVLLNRNADFELGVGTTPLYNAARAGHKRIVTMLLEKGAKVEGDPNHPSRPLHAAARGGHENIVEMLLDKGANVNASGEFGSALYAALKEGHEKTAEILLQNNADINVKAGLCNPALQAALESDCPNLVKILLDKGTDVNLPGGYYGTALQAASSQGYTDIVEMLLEKGAMVNTRGGHFGDALTAALCDDDDESREKTVELLLSKGAIITEAFSQDLELSEEQMRRIERAQRRTERRIQ